MSDQCDTCSEKNSGCTPETCSKSNYWAANELSEIKHVVAVMSGKGGVGKSSVTSLLAIGLARQGFQVGILDADITGPSIPKMFGIKERPDGLHDKCIFPVKSSTGIKIMSLNLLLPNEDDPVIWRGPIIAGAVKQFWEDVGWGKLDHLIVDLPPGTGDVPLSVMQSLPLDGLVVVSSPQDLAVMVVKKAIKMAEQMSIPILGLVENMSYLKCPDCGKEIRIFGASNVNDVALTYDLKILEVLAIDPELAHLCDCGKIEQYNSSFFSGVLV